MPGPYNHYLVYIDPKIWWDRRVFKLNSFGKLFLFYVLTCPENNPTGTYKFSRNAFKKLGFSPKTTEKWLLMMQKNGFLKVDLDKREVTILKFREYIGFRKVKIVPHSMRKKEEERKNGGTENVYQKGD